jgi:hypothetical protein
MVKRLEDFRKDPIPLRGMWLQISEEAQGYHPPQMLKGQYEIVSVHPFGITMKDANGNSCSILWIQTDRKWAVTETPCA